MEIIDIPTTGKGPAEWFTGDVYIDIVIPQDGRAQGRAAFVHFTPGARTAWHKHCNGQTLRVIEGVGLTQVRGGEVHRHPPRRHHLVLARRMALAWSSP